MSFQELGLEEGLLRAIAQEGYTEPTPIQQQAIPVILQGGDLLAAAQTGTGKTAAFTLPLLQRLHQRRAEGVKGQPRKPLALVLAPTRELAAQVAESVRVYGGHLPLRTAVVFGGVGIQPQIEALRHGVDILVATPGRLLDHLGQKTIDLSAVEILVLDEADRMLDMGFIHDIKRVLAQLPRQRQSLLFSATFSDDIRKLAHGFLREPAAIDVAPRNAAAATVEQRVVFVDKARKSELLAYLISSSNWQQTLVFARTKHGANRLVEKLQKWSISAAALHGNKSQNARTRALADLKSGAIRVLVATDIAARGLDIEQLPQVVNFELPNVPEDYVHRIGRTGRAGAPGQALSLVSADEKGELRAIQKLLKRELPSFVIDGFQPGTASPNPEPEEAPRPPQPQRGRGRGGEPRRERPPQPSRSEPRARPQPQGGPRPPQQRRDNGRPPQSPRNPLLREPDEAEDNRGNLLSEPDRNVNQLGHPGARDRGPHRAGPGHNAARPQHRGAKPQNRVRAGQGGQRQGPRGGNRGAGPG